MKRLSALLTIVLLIVCLGSCNEEKSKPAAPSDKDVQPLVTADNPRDVVPTPATVGPFEPRAYVPRPDDPLGEIPLLIPAELTAYQLPGESFTEDKRLYLPERVTAPQGDILFCFDLTSSMFGAFENVKSNSVDIMNEIQGIIPDSRFGVISHMDYDGEYDWCDYSNWYGSAPQDYDYSMDQALTHDIPTAAGAMGALTLGWGADGPENYSRAFFESYDDATIGFRDDVQKVVVAFLDNIPHDCDVYGDGTVSTGVDPGPDAIPGNADDLAILDVLDEMAANDLILIVIYSGYFDEYFEKWKEWTARTGGGAFRINTDGSIPGGMDIDEYIADKIEGAIQEFEEVELRICDPEYEGWVTSISPPVVNDVILGTPQTLDFEIEFTVPEDAEVGEHCFEICAYGDDLELARQRVCINVGIKVAVDIKPTSCPNPFELKAKGRMPVAIAGTGDFDVSQIDPETVRLEGVAPVRYSMEDVATPYWATLDDCYDCTTEGADGMTDLSLKFLRQEVKDAIGDVNDGDCIIFTLCGFLKAEYGGYYIKGFDIVRIQD